MDDHEPGSIADEQGPGSRFQMERGAEGCVDTDDRDRPAGGPFCRQVLEGKPLTGRTVYLYPLPETYFFL